MHLEVDRQDFRHTRLVDTPFAADLADGQVLLEVESFALTANNITYAVAGDMLDYWGFFPAEAPWGRVPVMGIGTISRSNHPAIPAGGRYFGFFPMASHHVVDAAPTAEGFTDHAPHRSSHAATYRSFNRVESDPAYSPDTEAQYLLTRGLFITSFLVDDFLGEHEFFGSTTTLVTSASSKTSIALAHCLHERRGCRIVGLTSVSNRPFVESLGLYDSVITYADIESLDANEPSVIVDMSGSAEVLGRLHRHLGEALRHSCRVGATHWTEAGSTDGLPGPTPTFFFAPSQVKKRSQEWGRDEFSARVAQTFSSFIDHAQAWLNIERSTGPVAVEQAYRAVLEGESRPDQGHILSLRVTADDIPVAHTPTGGWSVMPPPFLATCTEPIVAGAPDMRGTWRVVNVEANGLDDPAHPAIGKVQRIEQGGDRVIVTAAGIVHDMRCDGTEQHGVHDVAEFDKTTPITVVATYENGVHVLRPVGVPIEVTRRIEGDRLIWTYVGFTATLERTGEE